MKIYACAILLALTTGCTSLSGALRPQTQGERAANYGYVPLDPLPIETMGYAGSCKEAPKESDYLPVTQALPDIAVRFAIAESNGNIGLEFGPTTVTAKGNSYSAVLDYVNSDSVTMKFLVRKFVRVGFDGVPKWYELTKEVSQAKGDRVLAYQAKLVQMNADGVPLTKAFSLTPAQEAALNDESDPSKTEGWQQVAFPIYVGVGYRLTADFRALKGDVALGGLGSIGASADAEEITGSMTLQSIGVNGLGTTTTLVLPSKLDQTTIEQSILAIGTGRALIYSDPAENKVRLTPRVVGLYSPVGSDPRLINAVYSELSTIRVPWPRPCKPT